MTAQRKEWLKLCTAAVGFIVIVALARVVGSFAGSVSAQGDQLDELKAYVAAGRESRIEFQARETFLLCSRDLVKTVTPDRRGDVAEVCNGYETMERALATEHAKQDRAG